MDMSLVPAAKGWVISSSLPFNRFAGPAIPENRRKDLDPRFLSQKRQALLFLLRFAQIQELFTRLFDLDIGLLLFLGRR